MAYKFPYAGSEEKPRVVFRPPVKKPKAPAKQKISCVPDGLPDLPDVRKDIRPIDIPRMTDALRKVLLDVAEKMNVHPNDIVGSCREQKLTDARREFVWRARHETNSSFPRIGRAIGRDHTTALYHYQYKEACVNNEDPHKIRSQGIKRYQASVETQTELNERQVQIRGLILRGYKNPDIAAAIGVSISSVKYDRRVIKKLNPIPTA